MNELFNDVFQCHQTDRFIEGITLALNIDPLDEGHVAFITIFKVPEDDVESRIVEDKVTLLLVKLAKGLEGNSVFGIDKGQLFDKEKTNNVGPLSVVDWDSRESYYNSFYEI